MASPEDLAFLHDVVTGANKVSATCEDERRAVLVWASTDLGATYRDIAAAIGISYQAVARTVQRFKQRGDAELVARLRTEWEAKR